MTARREKPQQNPESPVRPEPESVATDSTVTLWPRASAGDRKAAEALVSRMRPYLRRVGRGRLPRWARGRAETEDLVQESLIRALNHIPRFEGQTIKDFRNWLHTVFRNLVIDETRYANRAGVEAELVADELQDEGLSPEEQLAEREHTDVFDAALERLRPEERLFVIHRLQHGLSFQELAETLGKPSAAAARMAYNRALAKLRNEVKRLVPSAADDGHKRH